MTGRETSAGPSTLSPDEAFALLGNDRRIRILRRLGEADRPLTFTELFDDSEMRDSGNFTYHLEKLTGHFVRQTEDGYVLRQAGNRVVEAILSGAVTESPVLEPTPSEKPCSYCGAPIAMTYYEEQVRKYCTECGGTYGTEREPGGALVPDEYGYLGSLNLPPAGVQRRVPFDILSAAYTWSLLEHFAWAGGLCPRCSAAPNCSVAICEDHSTDEGVCQTCDSRYAIQVRYECANCPAEHSGVFVDHLLTEPSLLEFLLDHGVNPLSPPVKHFSATVWVYEEELIAADPFRAAFTFTADGDSLTLTVDDDLAVVDVHR